MSRKAFETQQSMWKLNPERTWDLNTILKIARQVSSSFDLHGFKMDEQNHPGLREAVIGLKQDAEIAHSAVQRGDSAVAADAGVRVGMRYLAFLTRFEWPKSNGRQKHPVWECARKIYAANPDMHRKAICQDAIDQWQQDTGKKCSISVRTMVSHFREMI